MININRVVALSLALAMQGPVHSAPSNPDVKPHEWRLLPPACNYVWGSPGRTADPVTARRLWATNTAWTGLHHYCWAIVQEFRTFSPNMPRRVADDLLDAAIDNLDYVLVRSSPGFEFRPDMFVRKARLLARRGQFVLAAETANRLIAESPDLADGYISLADVYLKSGRTELAHQTLARAESVVKDKERFSLLKSQLNRR